MNTGRKQFLEEQNTNKNGKNGEKNEFCLVYIKFYIPVGNLVEAEWLP